MDIAGGKYFLVEPCVCVYMYLRKRERDKWKYFLVEQLYQTHLHCNKRNVSKVQSMFPQPVNLGGKIAHFPLELLLLFQGEILANNAYTNKVQCTCTFK